MLIEQIIEFKLKELGPLAKLVLLQLVVFMTKQKYLRNTISTSGLLFRKCLLHCPGFVHQIANAPDCVFRIDSI